LAEPAVAALDSMSLSELLQISIQYFAGKVYYVEKRNVIDAAGQLASYAPEVPEPLRPMFAKPLTYAGDQEYRFVFWVFHPRYGVMSVRRGPHDLPLFMFD
jgi:hypothetical protein